MAKTQAKQLVVCVDNDGYAASLEKRKIYVMLRDAEAGKHDLLRIIDQFGRRLSLSEGILPLDRLAAIGQEGRPGRCVRELEGVSKEVHRVGACRDEAVVTRDGCRIISHFPTPATGA